MVNFHFPNKKSKNSNLLDFENINYKKSQNIMFLREKPSISNQHVPNCWVFLLYQIYEMIRSVDNREVYNPVIVFVSFESFTRRGGGG